MTDKELKRLSRSELLELLLVQTRERERLEKELEEARKMLEDRQLRIDKAGDLAHAALEINGVMEAAQAAARQYLENIERMERETRRRCDEMLIKATMEAQKRASGRKEKQTKSR